MVRFLTAAFVSMVLATAAFANPLTNPGISVDRDPVVVTGDWTFDGLMDIGTNEVFNSADTTPNVSTGSLWTSNATSVTITDFDGTPVDGQMLYVRSGGATVYDCTSSGLDCGSADITTAAGDLTVWVYEGTDWDLLAFTDVSTDMGSGGGGGGTNTNASTICSGTTTYLDGEGNCDDIAAVYEDELTNSAGLLAALSDETGTGVAVFGTTPTIATPVLTLGTASSTASGRISYDAGNDRIVVGDGSATDDFYSGAHTSDTNANTVCSGSTTYLDGDGNCDNIGANTGDQTITLTGDVTGSGTGSFAATIQANSVALTTDTTGNYVATVAAGTGITIAEGDSEGSTKTVVSTLGTAIDSTEITDNTILEADLKAVDAPADEECLTYESTGGDFEWQACGSGGSSLPVDDTTSIAKGSADATKEVRFEVDGISTGNVRVLTMPDQNIDLTPGTGSFATEGEGTLASASLPRSGGQMTGNVTMSGSQTVDGRDLSVDGTKLDGIEASATADQTGAEIKTAYQAEANAFTDTKNTKLTGIETSATADQSNSEIKTAYEANSDTNEFSDAEQTKLAGIETAAKDDQTITLTGDVTGSGTGSFAATIQANSVALTTDTTGNYVATVAAGSGITVAGSDAEGATKTVTATLGTAIDSAEITDGVILEADLKVVDTPADEECLTYEATGGDFEWQACGSGGGGGGEAAFTAESTPGTTPTATGTDAIGIGDAAVAGDDSGDGAVVAIGASSSAIGVSSVAIGRYTDAGGANSIAIGGGESDGDSADATGAQSIAIGNDANATAARTLAIGFSANASVIGAVAIGGVGPSANASYAIAIGNYADATGANCIAIGGHATDADSADCTAANAISIGVKTLASGVDSVAIGNRATATDVGEFAYASGYFAAVGDAQTSMYVLRNQTTNATQTELFTNGSSTGISVATDSTVFYRISIAARRTDADNESAAYVIEGCIDNNAGTTALVGGLGTKTVVAEDTVAWDVTVTADNTNNEINILVTGEASKTIRWVATVVITTVSG